MKTTKDVKSYFEDKFTADNLCSTLCDCSINDNGVSIVKSSAVCYNFDEIVKGLMKHTSASVDCIYFHGSWIEFIEFKDGLISHDKGDYQPPDTDCEDCKKYHREKFESFKKYRKEKQKQLRENLQLKAAESLLVFQNAILPNCPDSEAQYSLRFVCVIKSAKHDGISPLDEFEIEAAELAKQPLVKSNLLSCLEKYGCEDKLGSKLFYEEVRIMMDSEFDATRRYNVSN